MAIQIQLRRDTAANWTTEDPILFQGELGLETDTGQMKMGDGTTTWSGIDYMDSTGVTDHGDLTGRDDDDHTQYHNNTRGDARYYTETELDAGQLDNQYYTETELDAGQLDNRYFRENEHLNSSAGAGDAGKPVKLDASGDVNISMIKMDDIDHGNLSGKDDDDHTQYHTDTRGDARYYTQSEVDARNANDLNDITSSGTAIEDAVTKKHIRSHTMISTDDHTAGNHKLFYSNGSGNLTELTHGTATHVLTSNGATSAPNWQEGGGISVHSELSNLTYATAGHTGFSPDTHTHDGRYYQESEVDTISGSLDTKIDAKPDTLLELTDTPAAYDTGKYLKSTTVGAEWATVSGGGHDYVKVSDVKSWNIDGGTFTKEAWQTRTINTEDTDTASICSISSNQITLAAGTYECYISCPGYDVNGHIARLYNITDSSQTLLGDSAHTSVNVVTCSVIKGKFTIAAQKTFEIQHQCKATQADSGFGPANNITGSAIDNVYAIAEFWRIGE